MLQQLYVTGNLLRIGSTYKEIINSSPLREKLQKQLGIAVLTLLLYKLL